MTIGTISAAALTAAVFMKSNEQRSNKYYRNYKDQNKINKIQLNHSYNKTKKMKN